MRIRRHKRPAQSGFFSRLQAYLPADTAKIVAMLVISGIMMLGVLPAKPLNSTTTPPSSLVKPDVLGTEAPSEPSIDYEIGSKEAEPEIIGPKVPILMYHYVEPTGCHDSGRDKLLVDPGNFEAQLKYLRDNGWTTITLDTLVAGFKNPSALPAKSIILTFDDGYGDFYTTAWPIIQKYQVKVTLYVLSRGDSLGAYYDPCMRNNFYMTNAQIRELAQSPLVTIASHTLDHRDLKALNAAGQKREIFESKAELEAITGVPVRHFAYPYGDFNPISLELVGQAGYRTAASTLAGTHNNDSTILSLRRLRPGNRDIAWFAQHLAKN